MNKRFTQILVFCSLILPAAGQTPTPSPSPVCEVKVSRPLPGDKVGKDGRVKGTATIPSGTYLWVLSHMKDLTEEWWPQGGRPASIDPKNKEWVIITAYGKPDDIQQDFEISIVVVNSDTNSRLRDWFKDAKAKDFPPIDFPTPVDGCLPIKIVVRKVSP